MLTRQGTLAADGFLALARFCARVPRFRGRNRALLALYRALGLAGEHIFVNAELTTPTRYRVRLDLHSWLQRIAFLDGGYEPEVVRLLLRLGELVDGDGALVDIGANVGLIAIPAALLIAQRGGAAPCVVAIEAIGDNAAALRENVARNDAAALVRVIETALGETEGTVDVQVEGDLKKGAGTGTANILPKGAARFVCERFPLRVTTLDALMAQALLPPRCAVVKIDTDGYDLKVLQGGQHFLATHRPVVFGEFAAHCMGWHGQTLADVCAFAETLDFTVWRRSGARWRLVSDDASPFVQDLLLAPKEKAHLLAPLLTSGM